MSPNGEITISAPLKKVEGVVIPNGFEHVSGTKVADGLVIKNKTDGNEFVWVPVEAGTFERNGFGTDLSSYSEPYEEPGYTSEKAEYDAMVASVEKYGGFYIGRYEASETSQGSGVAQSKQGKTPWSEICWGENMTDINGNGAVGKARAVYPDSSEKKAGDAISTLTYGVQWDAMIKFIKLNYPEIVEKSSEYGYWDSDYATTTGSATKYALNNIYDVVGNLWEWTMEIWKNGSGNYRVVRGSSFDTQFDGALISRIDFPITTELNPYGGFRIALYIK